MHLEKYKQLAVILNKLNIKTFGALAAFKQKTGAKTGGQLLAKAKAALLQRSAGVLERGA